jgi:hypothetical protein
VPVVHERDRRWHLYAVVSVNAFENVDTGHPQAAPVSFDAEDEARACPPQAGWIRDVIPRRRVRYGVKFAAHPRPQ